MTLLATQCTCRPDNECPTHGLDRTVNVTIEDAHTAGGCNFCSRPARTVRVVRSSGRSGVEVRFCPTCWKELRK